MAGRRVLPAGAFGRDAGGPLVSAELAGRRRVSSWPALAQVLGTPARRAGFAVVAAGVTLLYTILLPFDDTQRFELANWRYLNAGLLAWAVVLGIAMALVLSVQAYAMRKVAVARARTGAAGGVAFVVSLLPSFLCCTPIIPTLLAFVGVSGAGLYATTGSLQYFFATNQTGLLAASLALLVASGWWGLRKVAGAACLSGECGTGEACRAAPAGDQHEVSTADEGVSR
jgi:hypothetical protein